MGKTRAGGGAIGGGRGWVGGGGSIVAMRKQSNTNWSHSRGTAGAHRGDSLGGPTATGEGEGEGEVCLGGGGQVRDGDAEAAS